MGELYVDATAGQDFVLIDWNDEQKYGQYQEKKGYIYHIFWGSKPDIMNEKICNVNAPYKHENLIRNKTYYYKLVGDDKTGNSAESYVLDSTPGGESVGMSFLSRNAMEGNVKRWTKPKN